MKLYILTAFDSYNDRYILGVYTTRILADKAWDSWYAIASEDSATEHSKHIEEATLNEWP